MTTALYEIGDSGAAAERFRMTFENIEIPWASFSRTILGVFV